MPVVYIILMRRWGSVEGHTYIGGVYDNLEFAKEAAEEAANQRGGKYDYQIFRCRYSSMVKVFTTCHLDQVENDVVNAVNILGQIDDDDQHADTGA